MRLPSMTVASCPAAGLPEPWIGVPLRTTRVFLLVALMRILPVACFGPTLPPNPCSSQPQSARHPRLNSSPRVSVSDIRDCPHIASLIRATGLLALAKAEITTGGVVSPYRISLIFRAGEE